MIDVHSHILPHFDDGPAVMETSLEMLRESKRQGVDKIISTSHCYPGSRRGIDDFIRERAEGIAQLKQAIEETGEELPEIYMGCELNLGRDISDDPRLPELCTENTEYLLLEMPYTPWQPWHVEAVYKITLSGITPVMAHIDRFLTQKKQLLNDLFELDVLYQVNAEAFIIPAMKKQTDMLFETGRIHVLGSDMHNMNHRKPNLEEARKRIIKRYGAAHMDYLEGNAEKLLRNEPIDIMGYRKLHKKGFFERMFKK